MVKELTEDSHVPPALESAGAKLVIVDFHATWCGPCHQIAPLLEEMAQKYDKAVFLKVDVDKCPETASRYGVTAMPTFLLFRNKTKIDTHQGANAVALEAKIKKWYGSDDDSAEEAGVKGHMDLNTFITKSQCECLNEADDHPLSHALTRKGGFLESDCDEQLIMAFSFNQAVKLHSLKLHAPTDKGPKTIKLFINQPRTLDFDSAESMEAMQTLVLVPEDLEPGSIIPLRYVKFQNVQNLMLFVKDNQAEEETTQIDYISIIGSPINTTNMSDFKRVSGKKGESE